MPKAKARPNNNFKIAYNKIAAVLLHRGFFAMLVLSGRKIKSDMPKAARLGGFTAQLSQGQGSLSHSSLLPSPSVMGPKSFSYSAFSASNSTRCFFKAFALPRCRGVCLNKFSFPTLQIALRKALKAFALSSFQFSFPGKRLIKLRKSRALHKGFFLGVV